MKSNIKGSNQYGKHSKDTKFISELRAFKFYLKEHTATASMISIQTNISHKNICRYKQRLERAGLLWVVEKGYCIVTGYKAQYLTTDPNKAPMCSKQLSLW